jgi:hypothetical protein
MGGRLGETADPSAPLRFGRDDKGEGGASIFNRLRNPGLKSEAWGTLRLDAGGKRVPSTIDDFVPLGEPK